MGAGLSRNEFHAEDPVQQKPKKLEEETEEWPER